MGMFDDIDLSDAVDLSSFTKLTDSYACTVTNFEKKPTNDGTKTGIIIQYTVIQGKWKGQQIIEWQRVPSKTDTEPLSAEDRKKALNYLKTRLAGLGIPEEKMQDTEAEDVIGNEVIVRVGPQKDDDSRQRVLNVKPGTIVDDDPEEIPASGGMFE